MFVNVVFYISAPNKTKVQQAIPCWTEGCLVS